MDDEIYDEIFDEGHLKAIEDFRREVILEWRKSVQKALDGGATANAKRSKGTKQSRRSRKSQYDIRSSLSSSTSSSSQLPPPDYEASWRSKLAVWPWLLRASHSCGNTIAAFTKSTTLAVENCNYRDSFNERILPRLRRPPFPSAAAMDDLDMQAYKLLVDPTPPTTLRGSRPASKMKPNTRFLSHIVREAKSHNAALLARETADAQKRLKKLDGEDSGNEEEKDEKRHRRRHDSTRDSARHDDRHRRRRHHRDDDGGDHRDKHNNSSSHRHRSHRSHHRDSSREDREREREMKNRDRESKSRSRRHHRDPDDDRDDGRQDRDVDKDRRKHRERSNSPNSRRSRRRSASPRPSKHHHRHDRDRSHEREHTRDNTRDWSSYGNSDSDDSSDPLDEFVGPKLTSDHLGGGSSSGIRIRGRGAVSTSTSSMDKHFAADYDPTNDMEHPLPAPRLQVAPRLSNTITAEDTSTEMQEDRKQLLRDNTERLKAAGFTDKEIAILSRGGRRRLDSSNNNSGSGSNSPWAKKGEAREWDRDKVAGNDGPPKPEWAR